MKLLRDMELIKQILINTEKGDYLDGKRVKVEGVDTFLCAYNVSLMLDAGLVDGRMIKSNMYPYAGAHIYGLTNAGHDFLLKIKQDVLWRRALEFALEHGLPLVIQYIQKQASLLAAGVR